MVGADLSRDTTPIVGQPVPAAVVTATVLVAVRHQARRQVGQSQTRRLRHCQRKFVLRLSLAALHKVGQFTRDPIMTCYVT